MVPSQSNRYATKFPAGRSSRNDPHSHSLYRCAFRLPLGTSTEVPPRSTAVIEPISLVTAALAFRTMVSSLGVRFGFRSGRNDRSDLAPVCCSAAGERSRTTCPFRTALSFLRLSPSIPHARAAGPPPAAHFFAPRCSRHTQSFASPFREPEPLRRGIQDGEIKKGRTGASPPFIVIRPPNNRKLSRG